MSAPAIKLRPAPISTIALTAGSALPRSTAAVMPSGTPGDKALTGGLSIVMIPMPSSISKRTNSRSASAIFRVLPQKISQRDSETARGRSASQHEPPDPILQHWCIEIQQQPGGHTAQPHVCEYL